MRDAVRENVKLAAVMAISVVIASTGPALAHGVQHALFAHNADKVDGKHAVGAGSSIANRKGKVVATNRRTGLLPNNIIARAPNADRLDGKDSTAFARTGHLHDNRYLTEAESDDRYFTGSSVHSVAADGTPEANGAMLVNAIAAITDASAENPHAVVLAAGVYDVGAAGLDVKPFVELIGRAPGRTIVTAAGSTDLNPFDGGAYGTVRLVDSGARHLTIRNTGGTDAIAVGVEIGEGRGRLHDVEIDVSGGTEGNRGISPKILANAAELELVRGLVSVAGGRGIGGFSADRFRNLLVNDSRIVITGGGAGIAVDVGGASGSSMRVRDTSVSVSGGGTGFSGTVSGDEMTFIGTDITVTGGQQTRGLASSGSGFRPVLRNSTVSVSGGSSSNKAIDGGASVNVTLQGSRVTASGPGATAVEVGIEGFTFVSTVSIDSSVLKAATVLNAVDADARARVGASMLDGSTIKTGAGTFTCVASYTANYTALTSACA